MPKITIIDDAKLIKGQDDKFLHDYVCDCESPVYHYYSHWEPIKDRPESVDWDYWLACTNKDCEHHYGEGVFQNWPEWQHDRKNWKPHLHKKRMISKVLELIVDARLYAAGLLVDPEFPGQRIYSADISDDDIKKNLFEGLTQAEKMMVSIYES